MSQFYLSFPPLTRFRDSFLTNVSRLSFPPQSGVNFLVCDQFFLFSSSHRSFFFSPQDSIWSVSLLQNPPSPFFFLSQGVPSLLLYGHFSLMGSPFFCGQRSCFSLAALDSFPFFDPPCPDPLPSFPSKVVTTRVLLACYAAQLRDPIVF